MLREYQLLVIPGGFAYGDDVAAGKILANQLRLRLAEPILQFRDSGKLVLGICNGFQVLIKSGLLPGWENSAGDAQPATLALNQSGHFEDRWVHLAAGPGRCPFLAGVEAIELPVAHGEGRFVARDASVLNRLEREGQVVLRYVASPSERQRGSVGLEESPPRSPPWKGGASGRPSAESVADATRLEVPYPANPNGSERNVAGICDATGRVFGLMPHPERHADPLQHPRWTRRGGRAEGDGLAIFRNAVGYFA
jgi:phosphoribosylformylglycinamidine synthase